MTQTNAITNPGSESNQQARELILSKQDQYTGDIKTAVKWLDRNGLSFDKNGIEQYLDYIGGVRENGERYAVNSYNKKVSAIKSRIRLIFSQTDDCFSEVEQLRLQAYLDTLKYRKVNSTEITEDKILTPEEIQILIELADPHLSLMIEFLSRTGCRISEMINVLKSECTLCQLNYKIRMLGKGGKERFVFIEKALYRRIQAEFQDSVYLFGHNGSPYSRISVTTRIRILAKTELQKNASAHTLRHSFVTTALERGIAIEKVSKYVGHASLNITDKLYNHNSIRWEEIAAIM